MRRLVNKNHSQLVTRGPVAEKVVKPRLAGLKAFMTAPVDIADKTYRE